MTERVALSTERLQLEPFAPDHAEAVYGAVMESRRALLRWMPWARDPSREGNRRAAQDAEQAWREGRRFHFVIVERATLQVIGVAGLDRAGGETAEVQYWIRTDRAGGGLTTEACAALIEWAPGALAVRHLTLWAGLGEPCQPACRREAWLLPPGLAGSATGGWSGTLRRRGV